ncbi:MAG TPA: siroheme synthase CysG [Burkholderiales bacterium]|nr:siroheme synthase CysG [Burkholderiales bacterium]
MNWFPVFINLQDAPCLVVGGGAVALRKTRQLLAFGARVSIAAPLLHDDLTQLLRDGRITHAGSAFDSGMLGNCTLAVAATGDSAVNRKVSEAARALRVPVNVVDDPSQCDFITPAIVQRDPVVIAISSGGTAPVIARQLKSWLEAQLPRGLGVLAGVAGGFRPRVKARIASPLARRRFWERVLGDAVAKGGAGESADAIRRMIEAALDSSATAQQPRGMVYLVGAGPGDAELLTLKALRLLQQADVVLHDDLVSDDVLDLVRPEAERMAVGKRCGKHKMAQADINALMVTLASQGKRVIRLKGGDPLIFGRCGEEMEALADAEIPFQVVPGITAASGCGADAAIPLTHRDYAHSCLFINGHKSAGDTDIRWPVYSASGQTLVVYMGLSNLASICHALRLRGWPKRMAAALIANGTRPERQVVAGTLADLPEAVRRRRPAAPALLIVGDVVNLHYKLVPPRHGPDGPVETDAAASGREEQVWQIA